ncbi:MAG: sulfotransferase [Cellvibrionaceae bacterium]
MNSAVQKKQILILGMHRSGTSLVANLVAHSGISVGDELVKASASNVDGHYEDKAIVELNEEILGRAGFRWDEPPSYQQALALDEGCVEKFQRYVNARSRQSETWAAKDPRLSLTIPILHPLLSNPHYIVCYRNENAVAESLGKRDGFSTSFSVGLKKRYDDGIAQFFAANPDVPCLPVEYDNLLNNPRDTVTKLYEFMGVEASADFIDEAAQKIRSRSDIQQSSLQQLRSARNHQLRKLVSNPLRILTPPFWRRFMKLNRRYKRSLNRSNAR